jgi:hypothetical protein
VYANDLFITGEIETRPEYGSYDKSMVVEFYTEIGIYRDADNGPCAVCLHTEKDWEDRTVEETAVYNSKFQVQKNF